MDAIKSKMKKLAKETYDATEKANKFDDEVSAARGGAEKIENSLAGMQKKYQTQESAYDCAVEDLFNLSIKLEEKEKILANAEGEVGAGIRYEVRPQTSHTCVNYSFEQLVTNSVALD